jgi:hypothetical protein
MIWAIEAALEVLAKQGHTGDLVELSRQDPKSSEPVDPSVADGGIPLDEAEQQFQANNEKVAKRRIGRKPKAERDAETVDTVESFRAAQRAENAKGDQHIKDQLAKRDAPKDPDDLDPPVEREETELPPVYTGTGLGKDAIY